MFCGPFHDLSSGGRQTSGQCSLRRDYQPIQPCDQHRSPLIPERIIPGHWVM